MLSILKRSGHRVLIIMLVALLLTPSIAGWGWGEGGHKAITRIAVESIPEPLRAMLMPYLNDLEEASMDPDRRKSEPGNNESIRHYLDIDALEPFPFTNFPHERNAAEAKYGRLALESEGIVPWATEESFNNLVQAWRDGDGDWVRWFGDLAHYVGDTHQPMHTTANFDGQKTGNNGIHALFESVMFDGFWEDEFVKEPSTSSSGGSMWMPIGGGVAGGGIGFLMAGPPGALIGALVGAAGGMVANLLIPSEAQPITDPLKGSFDILKQSYQHLDTLLSAHTKAKEYRQTNPKFYSTFWDEGAKQVMIEQINRGGEVLARFIYGAWIEAGRPSF